LKVPILTVLGENNMGLWTSEKLSSFFHLVFTLRADYLMMTGNLDFLYREVTEFIQRLIST